jgi:hypothetical protein
MSIPITCTAAFQRKDVLFYVLFGANADYICRLIEDSVINVAREYNSEGVSDALQLLRPHPLDSLHRTQMRFFLLLNEDETMRRHLSALKSNLMTSLCPHKAERFYDALCDELIPSWIKDGRMTSEAFVDSLRAAYLCS